MDDATIIRLARCLLTDLEQVFNVRSTPTQEQQAIQIITDAFAAAIYKESERAKAASGD